MEAGTGMDLKEGDFIYFDNTVLIDTKTLTPTILKLLVCCRRRFSRNNKCVRSEFSFGGRKGYQCSPSGSTGKGGSPVGRAFRRICLNTGATGTVTPRWASSGRADASPGSEMTLSPTRHRCVSRPLWTRKARDSTMRWPESTVTTESGVLRRRGAFRST